MRILRRWQSVLLLMICFTLHGATDPLLERAQTFMCAQKQKLHEADLTAPCPVTFWVSPEGSDLAAGTETHPFQTLERARDAVRALPPSAFAYRPVTIYLKEGTYRLQHPLELTPMDSGRKGKCVIYSAAPGAHPVISGAVQVTGWTLHDGTLGIYRAQAEGLASRQLYVNGVRAERAQTTANPAGFLPAWNEGGIKFIPTALNPAPWRDASLWTNPQNIEAVIVTQWKMMRVPLQSISPYVFPLNGLITLKQPAWDNANIYRDKETMLPGEWSFWEVTRFENAYEFLTEPGQWYLDTADGWLYYIPRPGEDLNSANVELPLLENLIIGHGTVEHPLHHIRFEGLTFAYATWLGPSGQNGYVSDQSGQILLGFDHPPNTIGHDPSVEPTPGNLTFTFAHHLTFYGNIFEHLGAVGLSLGVGTECTTVESNLFTDISSSAIMLGGVTENDAHPSLPGTTPRKNTITNNLIRSVAKEYVDAAGIFVGFSHKTTLRHNTIVDVPWAGIAMGWGWGLYDVGSFPGLLNAYSGQWGTILTPTPNGESQIVENRIDSFLNLLWDGGAIYTTGQQGPSLFSGLLIMGNVATGKRPEAGGNTFYTDGGSRYIRLDSNVSYDNPIGETNYGPPPQVADPFFFDYPPYYLQNGLPYGSDLGGCVTYGDLLYTNNYWLEAPIPENEATYNAFYLALIHYAPYSPFGFFNICPYSKNGISYPTNLIFEGNHSIKSKSEIPPSLLSNAGVQSRPPTIPQERWILP